MAAAASAPSAAPAVGVLALQGDFAAHEAALLRAGARGPIRRVRRPADLDGLTGLALPGGESTTLLKLLAADGLDAALVTFARGGGALLATCAGVILIATEVENPRQRSLGLLDVRVERNSYGRQVDSFIGTAEAGPPLGPSPLPAVFIRAPRLLETGAAVEVLARCPSPADAARRDPVLVRQGHVLGATFHPELTDDSRVHALFLAAAREAVPLPGLVAGA